MRDASGESTAPEEALEVRAEGASAAQLDAAKAAALAMFAAAGATPADAALAAWDLEVTQFGEFVDLPLNVGSLANAWTDAVEAAYQACWGHNTGCRRSFSLQVWPSSTRRNGRPPAPLAPGGI
jgi:hypothetical protein